MEFTKLHELRLTRNVQKVSLISPGTSSGPDPALNEDYSAYGEWDNKPAPLNRVPFRVFNWGWTGKLKAVKATISINYRIIRIPSMKKIDVSLMIYNGYRKNWGQTPRPE